MLDSNYLEITIDKLPEKTNIIKVDNTITINFDKDCDIIINQCIDFVQISSITCIDRSSISIKNNEIELYKGHGNSIYIKLSDNSSTSIRISYKDNSYIIDILK